jgi:hypothetical protein
MLGLNLGRYVIVQFNIVCGTLLFLSWNLYINKKKEHISCGFIKEEKNGL